MNAEILKIQKEKAKDGGFFWYVFLKNVETKISYRACVYERFRNFAKWERIITGNSVGLILGNLNILRDKVVDADSAFTLEKRATTAGEAEKEAPEAIVAPLFCAICGLKINKGLVCQMTVNCGGGEDDYIKLDVHVSCQKSIFEIFRAGNEWKVNETNEMLLRISREKKVQK